MSPRLDAASEQILLAQIEAFKPDVVLNQDVFHVDVDLMRRIKQMGKPILVGQVGIEPSRGVDWTVYDLLLSQLPRIVQSFRAAGVRAEVAHLAFEPRLLDDLPPAPAQDVDISFVGSVSEDHRQRIALLEAVAARHDLKLWGNIPRSLPRSSPLHRCFQGEVWGAEMYQTLRRSRITLNSHIDIAGREAGNMRLFEATGVGAFLLTDFKDNLHELFEPDREVAVWRSIDDCLGDHRPLSRGYRTAARRSRAPARRGPWHSTPTGIARGEMLKLIDGHSDSGRAGLVDDTGETAYNRLQTWRSERQIRRQEDIRMHSVLITGGAGFIGQNLVHRWSTARPEDRVVVVDALTYAANIRSLEPLIADRRIVFVKGDIGDAALDAAPVRRASLHARAAPRRRIPCRSLHRRARARSCRPT